MRVAPRIELTESERRDPPKRELREINILEPFMSPFR